ncbi:hypothetical protein CA601_29515 [Paraburkholderia hospita]|nr:hypothetical protein CA601_29515 [Paraburkholderia hospita]
MKRNLGYLSIAFLAVTCAIGTAACKKVDDKSSNSMDSGSSGVMSNTAGVNGTPGQSSAANSTSESAAASAPSASSEAPVAGTPSSSTTVTPSGASQ